MGVRQLKLFSASLLICAVALVGTVSAGAQVTSKVQGHVRIVVPKFSPHVSTPTRTYDINTTADSELWSSAPAHTCEDETNHALCSLRAAIDAVNLDFETSDQWDVINVPAGDYKLLQSVNGTALIVDEPGALSIVGAGPGKSIIDGSSGAFGNNFFDLDAPYIDASFQGLTFEGGKQIYGVGGAVYIIGSSSLHVNDCAFYDNTTNGSGGAVEVDLGGWFEATDTTFTSNSAAAFGGAIYSKTTKQTVLSGDTFSNNTASLSNPSDPGGAVYAAGDLAVDNSTFSENETEGIGGAVDVSGNSIFTNDTFSGNESLDDTGGAIYSLLNITLLDSKLSNNVAEGAGGALYDYQNAYLKGDAFSGNTSDYDGGDIFVDDNATVDNSTFKTSTAEDSGGSIYINPYYLTSLSNDTFSDAKSYGDASGEGGGAIYVDSEISDAALVMNNVSINGAYSNGSDSDGGAGIYLSGTVATLENVSITNTDAYGTQDTSGGGGIYCAGCEVNLVNSLLSNTDAAGSGGAIYESSDSFVNVENSSIINGSGENAGAIADFDAALLIDNSTVDHFASLESGGGALLADSTATVTIDNSTLSNNDATSEIAGGGGAIEIEGSSTVNLNNDTLADNDADWGGAIYLDSGQLDSDYSTIVGNTARVVSPNFGGGIYSSGDAAFVGTIIASNTSPQCAGDVIISGGYNLDSDNSCGFTGIGDLVSTPANVGSLQNNGGPTKTVAPLATSAAIGNGGTACPDTDQRGVAVTVGQKCDIGAVFVEKTSTTLASSLSTLVKGHEQLERFTIVVTPAVAKATPSGSASVYEGSKLLCIAKLSPIPGSKAVSYTGSCSPAAAVLANGSYSVTASYDTYGAFASSSSAAKKIKVT
jgi:predicted outer membrane repeat protein